MVIYVNYLILWEKLNFFKQKQRNKEKKNDRRAEKGTRKTG